MRKKTNLFLIDGLPMLAPDENVEISMEDIDASDSGRDPDTLNVRVADAPDKQPINLNVIVKENQPTKVQ